MLISTLGILAANRRATISALLALVLGSLSACASYSKLPALPEADSSVYLLGPGDQVRIITFGEQQLTGEFRVDAAGDIALPLIGTVHAAGLTPTRLDAAVESAMTSSKLYRNPRVSSEVINYRPIFILGEVTRPGQYPYQPGMTTLTAVAVAGGFTYRAVQDHFSILRSNNLRTIEGRADRATIVQPGDVMTVFERIF
jgi:polysaccharide export outer membrane protein